MTSLPQFTHIPQGLGTSTGLGGTVGGPGLPSTLGSPAGLSGMTYLDAWDRTAGQITNEPIKAKYSVKFRRTEEAVWRQLGPGHLLWGCWSSTASKWDQGAIGGVDVEDPMSYSGLNEWLRLPAQRATYGASKSAPTDFKFLGVQNTEKPARRGGSMGNWSEAVLDVTAYGFHSNLPNIALAFGQTGHGDMVYDVMQRKEYRPDDYTLPIYSLSTRKKGGAGSVFSAEEMVERSMLKHVGAAAEADLLKIKSLQLQIDELRRGPSADGASDTLIRRKEQQLKELKVAGVQLDRGVDAVLSNSVYKGERKSTVDGKEYHWQHSPYVSRHGERPPQSLYMSDMCNGYALPLYGTLKQRPVKQWSSDSLQRVAKDAIFPRSTAAKSWLESFVKLPQTEAVILRQK